MREKIAEKLSHMQEIKNKTMLARNLRQSSTDAESRLWNYLRSRQFYGYKFKRQKLIGKYIVDFVCVEEKVVIELDGGRHLISVKFDELRTLELSSMEYKVIRFWNNEVMNNIDGVLQRVKEALTLASPAGGRGEMEDR